MEKLTEAVTLDDVCEKVFGLSSNLKRAVKQVIVAYGDECARLSITAERKRIVAEIWKLLSCDSSDAGVIHDKTLAEITKIVGV